MQSAWFGILVQPKFLFENPIDPFGQGILGSVILLGHAHSSRGLASVYKDFLNSLNPHKSSPLLPVKTIDFLCLIITELWLARQLRPYGVRTKTMWIGNHAARGYEKSDFDDAFERYIPKEQAKRMLEELRAAAINQNVIPADETGADTLAIETT